MALFELERLGVPAGKLEHQQRLSLRKVKSSHVVAPQKGKTCFQS